VENGRPSKLTKQTHENIVSAIQRGAYIETAAAMAGINKTTFYGWIKKGKAINDMLDQASENQKPAITTQDANLVNFYNSVQKAQAESEIRDIAVIDSAAQQGQWAAAAWKLERKHHSRWGRKVAVTDEQGGNFFDGMAKAWANALAADVNKLPTIEGESVKLIED
jgi:hypothetical protein